MKIVHITESYIEGWGYQENLLPLYQRRAGHDVTVISNNHHLVDIRNRPDLIQEVKARGKEYWHDGIKVYKIETYLNVSSNTSFICTGLYRILEKERPEMIFHHNVGLATLTIAARYKSCHPGVKLYVDNHADWINESKNKLWHLLFYDMAIPLQVKCLGDKVDYYIGVSPLRCQYLRDVFHVPERKIRFLPIGCDTEQAGRIKESREELKKGFGLPPDAFVVTSGGKMDRTKGTLELVAACRALRQKGQNIWLVLFGTMDAEVASVTRDVDWVIFKGWCDRKDTFSILKMADCACWPWLHTTLIEDAVAAGTPLVVKLSDNVSHFAAAGAGIFMKNGDTEELQAAFRALIDNTHYYREKVGDAQQDFSYASLVRKLHNEEFVKYEQL